MAGRSSSDTCPSGRASVTCSARHWKADFGDREPWHYREYGDLDGDGLPNWFEMYWFTKERGFEPSKKATIEQEIAEEEVKPTYSKWLDFSTATLIDP